MANRILKYKSTNEDNYTGTQGLVETGSDKRTWQGVKLSDNNTVVRYENGLQVAESEQIVAGVPSDITLALNPDKTLVYAIYEGGFKVLNYSDLTTVNTYSIVGMTGTPTKLEIVDSKLVFTTDNNKLNSCNLDGTGLVSADVNNSFGFDNFVYSLLLDTDIKIKKYNTSLVEQSSTTTTLTTDTLDLDWFTIGDYVYSLIQSATDNDTKLLRFSTVTETYDTLLLPVTYNTATKFVKEITSKGNYAHVFTSSGVHYRVDLDAFASAVTIKRESAVNVGGVVTIKDSTNIATVEESLILTSGWGDSPQG